jgi:anti-sigma factor RsiW
VGESDCQNIREMLDLYLDNELQVETNQSVLEHLAFCADCAAESERRIELRRRLKAALTLENEDERTSENISRRRIESALGQERRPRRTTKIVWGALAAGLILTCALGLTYWRFGNTSKPLNSSAIEMPSNMPASSPQVLIANPDRDAVDNHQVCALSYPANWTFDRQRVARDLTPGFAPLIDSIGRKHASYELIEGHICSYQQKKYAHLIFRGNGHTVSVFIEPDEPSANPKPSHPREIDQASITAYQVASVDTGRHRISVVSDLPNSENLALAKQILPQTISFIRKMENAGV